MFSAIRSAAPRIGARSSPRGGARSALGGGARGGGGAAGGAGAAARGRERRERARPARAAARRGRLVPNRSRKNSRQSGVDRLGIRAVAGEELRDVGRVLAELGDELFGQVDGRGYGSP